MSTSAIDLEQLSFEEKELIRRDPVLGNCITTHGPLPPPPKRDYFEALVRSVIGQQISVKAAAVIFERYKTITRLDPERAARLSSRQTSAIRTSGPKIRYLKNVADYFVAHRALIDTFPRQSDEEIITELTRIKGIGRWSAEMFLMLPLQRPDVFAVDDLGLRLAVERLYKRSFTRSELTTFSERWAPYRSAASFHLWQTLRSTPIMDEL